ncbi:hypothetical protein EDD15DRAFT_2237164 [Pisolithus albus]|nr:hypothetical protein EDD15DRAFT_2237164 [Pisolithus albus]
MSSHALHVRWRGAKETTMNAELIELGITNGLVLISFGSFMKTFRPACVPAPKKMLVTTKNKTSSYRRNGESEPCIYTLTCRRFRSVWPTVMVVYLSFILSLFTSEDGVATFTFGPLCLSIAIPACTTCSRCQLSISRVTILTQVYRQVHGISHYTTNLPVHQIETFLPHNRRLLVPAARAGTVANFQVHLDVSNSTKS